MGEFNRGFTGVNPVGMNEKIFFSQDKSGEKMIRPFMVRLCLIGVLLMVVFSFGCAHRYYFEPTINDQAGRFYVPKRIPIKPGMSLKPEFEIVNEVALVNIQSDIFPYPLGKYTHTWTGNLRLWTDTAIGVLKSELERKDVTVRDDSEKMLMLSVTHAELFWGFRVVECTLRLQVATRDGYIATYDVTSKSKDLHDSCDSAVTKAVAKMFDDDKIRKYLRAPEGPKDTDCDGVYDDKDECPDTPLGVEVDEKGCPLDSDGDGVPDYRDECPDTPLGVEVDEKGCPLDTDGDGVPDYLDQCPDTPGGARVDERGCWVIDGAFFDFDKYVVKPKYIPVLGHVVDVLLENPGLRIEIQGHTDNFGTLEYNQILSENRAGAVMSYLLRNGIERDRLTVKGFSFNKPIATNETEEGRALNRRVELKPILKGQMTDSK